MSAPRLTPLAVAALRVGRPERILVVGCGDGDAVMFLAREFPAARVRGVDRDSEAVRAATARVGLDPEGRVAFKQNGRRALPFPDGFFDFVVVLDAPPHPRELARVLHAGGHLALVQTDHRQAPGGLRARLMARRLAARGFELAERDAAAAGSLAILRLREVRSRRGGE